MLNSTTYTVQAGDTLFRIGLKFNVSVSDLVTFNRLSNKNLIVVGQVLQIPTGSVAPPPPEEPPVTEGNVYIVQPGDTLFGIAQKFGISISALTSANGITTFAFIHPGQRLIIPTLEMMFDTYRAVNPCDYLPGGC